MVKIQKLIYRLIPLITGIFFASIQLCYSQEDDDEQYYQDLLKEEVEVENPVYKPVIGIGYGMFTFYGDVKNDYNTPVLGTTGLQINLATFIDNKHFFRADFFFMQGKLTGYNRNLEFSEKNLNFQSDLILFGADVNYRFEHIIGKTRKLHPFISAGFETFQFKPKGDLYYNDSKEIFPELNGDADVPDYPEIPYYYWTDGTITYFPEADVGTKTIIPISRDYVFETDLRTANIYGKGEYQQYSFAIPLGFGFDFSVSDRVTLRLGNTYHVSFTDFLDNLDGSENHLGGNISNPNIGGNAKNDNFNYTYVMLHLDLFSDAKVITVEKYFADMEFDHTMFDDEDYDNVFDRNDLCPGTPYGIQVDSVGCPYDSDNDGVPDYMDKEVHSRTNAIVDENGIEISEDELIAKLNGTESVRRSEVDLNIITYSEFSKYRGLSNMEVPAKFKSVDTDNDGSVSFEEVLDAIDKFFDFDSNLNTDDIYELNNFFFSQ